MGSILSFFRTILIHAACLILMFSSGCVTSTDFNIKDLAKTNTDRIFEIHLKQVTLLLRELTVKLYKKNPSELKKNKTQTIESRLNQIFTCPPDRRFAELEYKNGTDAILLGFDPGYEGDRVFAMMNGLYTMIHESYNDRCELFILDFLNEQALYNSARNIEILVWQLNTKFKENGSLFILTNSLDTEVKNLSYERVFGKLISLQDTMALIVAGRTGRMITEVVHIAGMAFLPIGF